MARGDIASNKTMVSFVIPKDLKEEAHKIATKENRSLSNLLVTLLKDYVEKYNAEHSSTQDDAK